MITTYFHLILININCLNTQFQIDFNSTVPQVTKFSQVNFMTDFLILQLPALVMLIHLLIFYFFIHTNSLHYVNFIFPHFFQSSDYLFQYFIFLA